MCLLSKIEKNPTLLWEILWGAYLNCPKTGDCGNTSRKNRVLLQVFNTTICCNLFFLLLMFFVPTLWQIRYFEPIYSRGLFHAGVLQNLHRVSLLKFNQFVFASLSLTQYLLVAQVSIPNLLVNFESFIPHRPWITPPIFPVSNVIK